MLAHAVGGVTYDRRVAVRPIRYRVHALERMAERGISPREVRAVVETGETIEDYPDDQPYPSSLVFAIIEDRPLHVVVADAGEDGLLIVTVYEPDRAQWDSTFRWRVKP